MNKQQVITELTILEARIDHHYGKFQRLLMHGWLSKPAWARAAVWFLLGVVTALALR